MQALRDLLKPERLTAIVDIGGADLQGKPPYQRMLDEGMCTADAIAFNIHTYDPQQSPLDIVDLLKITGDFPLSLLQAGPDKVAAHVSTAFFPTYSFGPVDAAMREMGFILHCFADCYIVPVLSKINVPHPDPHQIAQVDLFYVRDFTQDMGVEQWKHLAMLAHHVCGSYDLAMLAVSKLSENGAIDGDAPARYRRILETL